MLFDDQLAALRSRLETDRHAGTATLDFALLLDGLAAEREQGITIDVAYRYFSTRRGATSSSPTRRATSSTRATWSPAPRPPTAPSSSSTPRKGVLTQTRRHTLHRRAARHPPRRRSPSTRWISSTTTRRRSATIEADYRAIAGRARPRRRDVHPGVGAARRQRRRAERRDAAGTPARRCCEYLEAVEVDEHAHAGEAVPAAGAVGQPARPRLPRLRRHDRQRRRAPGRPGARAARPAASRPSSASSPTTAISTLAVAGQAVTLTLADEIDVSRGDVLAATAAPPRGGRPVRGDDRLDGRGADAARPHLPHARRARAPSAPRSRRSSTSSTSTRSSTSPPTRLELNEIGVCDDSSSTEPIAFDPYTREPRHRRLHPRSTGSRTTRSAPGLLHFALRRSQNVHWQALDVDKAARAGLKGQRPCVLWFTGLSGAGKSTIANLVEKQPARARLPHLPARRRQRPPRPQQGPRLHRRRPRREHPPRRRGREADGRRRADRASSRSSRRSPASGGWRAALVQEGEFVEVFVDTPLARRRGARPEGALQEGARGELKNFTGIDSPYEAPEHPELRIDTAQLVTRAGGRGGGRLPRAARDAPVARGVRPFRKRETPARCPTPRGTRRTSRPS